MVGRSAGWRVGTTFAVALLFGAIPLQAQSPPDGLDPEPDFAAQAIVPAGVWVLDAANVFTVDVLNKRTAPQVAIVRLQAIPAGGGTATILIETVAPIRETTTLNGTWDGRDDSGAAMTGPLTLTLTVQPASGEDDATPADNVRTVAKVLDRRGVALRLVQPPPATIVPGETVHALLEVSNTGTLDDSAALAVSPVSSWEFSLSNANVALPRSDPVRAVVLAITATAGLAPGSTAVATVTASSPNPPGPLVQLPVQAPTVVASGQFRFTLPTPVTAAPGDTARFAVTVQNDRNGQETVELQMAAASATDLVPAVTPTEPATIASGASQAFSVEVPVPEGQAPGVHQWRPTVTGAGFSPQAAPGLVTVQVPHIHRPTLELVSAPATFEPGVSNPLRLRLGNAGNGDDVVRVEVLEAPSGWTVHGLSSTPLAAGATAEQDPRVIVPGSTPAGQAVLRLAPVGSDGARGPTLILSRPVPQRTLPVVEPSMPQVLATRNEAVETAVTLRNAGNVAGTFTIAAAIIEAEPAGWTSSLDVSAPFTLDAGGSRTARLTVKAPDTALSAGDGATVGLELRDTAATGRVGQAVVRALPPFADLEVRWNGTVPETPYQGHPLQVSLVVANRGTARSPEALLRTTLAGTPGGPPIQVFDTKIPSLGWLPGQNETTLLLPLPSNRASLSVAASADFDLQVKEGEEENNDVGGAILLRTFGVVVEKAADRAALPGEAVALDAASAFRVRNLGNQSEILRVESRVQPLWRSPSNLNVTLAPGQGVNVPITFLLPEFPGEPLGNVSVQAVHTELPLLSAQGVVAIRILDTAPPAITEVAANRTSIPAHGPVLFQARIRDAVGIDSAGVVLVSQAGQVQRLALQATGDRYSAATTLNNTGSYTWHVWARDRASPANLADTAASPKSIHVEVDRNPALHRISPAVGQPVKPGTFLVLAVSGPTQLRQASSTIGGVATPLAPSSPLQVDTLGLSDGNHSFRVAVLDAAGGTAASNHTVLIDGTAPALLNFSVAEDAPGRYRVLAEVDDGSPVNVTVRLMDSTGSGHQVRLEPENGTQTALLSLPKGLKEVRVVLEDAAGNTALIEYTPQSLRLAGAAHQEADSLGAVVPLLLLAVVVAVRRRGGLP